MLCPGIHTSVHGPVTAFELFMPGNLLELRYNVNPLKQSADHICMRYYDRVDSFSLAVFGQKVAKVIVGKHVELRIFELNLK